MPISLSLYSQRVSRIRFLSRFGSFFPQAFAFNKFSASFSGSFCPILECRSFVFNNFSGSFLQKWNFLSHADSFPGSATG